MSFSLPDQLDVLGGLVFLHGSGVGFEGELLPLPGPLELCQAAIVGKDLGWHVAEPTPPTLLRYGPLAPGQALRVPAMSRLGPDAHGPETGEQLPGILPG